jgi:hypothetical protein
MNRRRIVTALALLGAAALAGAAVPTPKPAVPLDPVFVEGSQYTATLDQGTRNWRLLPLDGQDVVIANPDVWCRADAAVPKGVWLVSRDAQGGIELIAPSVTALPKGHSGRVALLPCGSDEESVNALHAPQMLIDLLATNAGAVYVH